MRQIFDSRRKLQTWLDVEVALAQAEAELGLIPKAAAERIAEVADASLFDMDSLRGEFDLARRHLLYPTVQALSRAAGEGAGKYVHWGATTQDVVDTGLVLQIRDALSVIEEDLAQMMAILSRLAKDHRDRPMAGRTHWQHALPITLGMKLSVFLDELDRHQKRLTDVKGRILTAQLWGGGGTLASLGEDAKAVQEAFGRYLGLEVSDAPWFAARDRMVELVSFLGMLAASMERLLLEIGRSAGTEIGELFEPRVAGQVGSSTMPQKRNPIQCERAAAVCKLIRGLVSVAQECAVVEHDRDMSTAVAEWFVVPQALIMTGGVLEKTAHILDGLVVDVQRIDRNLDISAGGIVAEAVMFGLAKYLGRFRAHELIMDVAKSAAESGRYMIDVLLENDEVMAHVSERELRQMADPRSYLGLSTQIVDSVTARMLDAQ